MLNKLFNYFKTKHNKDLQKKSFTPNIIRIPYLDLEKTNIDFFKSIYNNELDCLIINNFVSDEEISIFNNEFENYKKKYPFLINNKKIYNDEVGFTFGETIIDNSDIISYKKNASIYNQNIFNLTNLPLTNRFIDFFYKISNQVSSGIAQFEDGVKYYGHSIRNFNSNGKGIFNHADLITHQKKKHIKPLLEKLDTETILSFFVLINKPQKGGELKIYDDYYFNLPLELKTIFDKNYKKIDKYIDKLPSYNVQLNEGDLILFNAGQQWHKVEPIGGKRNRVTIGGFVGYNKKKTEIIFWS